MISPTMVIADAAAADLIVSGPAITDGNSRPIAEGSEVRRIESGSESIESGVPMLVKPMSVNISRKFSPFRQ